MSRWTLPSLLAWPSAAGGASPSRTPLTVAEVKSLYQRPRAFTDLLPWTEYLPESRCFLLEDGVSVGALWEITPAGTEARTPDFLRELRDGIQSVLIDALPEEQGAPWILQIYVQDEPSLAGFARSIENYVRPQVRETAFTQTYLSTLNRHLRAVSQAGGLFKDTAVTGTRWQGKVRRVRAVLYRRYEDRRTSLTHAVEALNEVAIGFIAALESAGIRVHRSTGRDFHEWMLKWFNPRPSMAAGDPDRLLEVAPYPGDEDLPFGHDFAEGLTLGMPRSDNATGTWWFDGLPHAVVPVMGLRRAPDIGHVTAARVAGDNVFALFDRMPEYTVMAMTVTLQAQDEVRNHIARIKRTAVGDSPEAEEAALDANEVEHRMVRGDKLFPCLLSFYVRGDDLGDLNQKVNDLSAVLAPRGLQPLARETDLLRLDSYIRSLPMVHDPSLDKLTRRSRLVFSSHAANLLPVYGRSRGTGHPGLTFYNRGGEPLVFDPLHREDRKKNAHMLILGPTGAGKSALLVYLLRQVIAIHRPRIFIIEAGNSFGLLAEHLATHDLAVNRVTLNPGSGVSLPPFSGVLRLFAKDPRSVAPADTEPLLEGDDDDDLEDERRDLLGEMEIAARIMITGADEREDARMTRSDRLLIRKAILGAAQSVRASGRPQALTEDVVAALRALSRDEAFREASRERAAVMADGMELFCSGLAGEFFNRPGQRWPRADVTHVDMGILAREGYEDQLTVAYLGLMNHINDLVEQHQHDERPTLVVTDEGHIITTNPLLAPYVVKITKMWRKLGAWFWIATQNLEDFPDASKRMLNMMEWWLCLTMPKEEIGQIARFKALNEEQRSLLLSARKEPGKFTEGVVLADNLETLFRNVPPALDLALAMTEKEEKAERAEIMREHGCTELEAAYRVAERIEAGRG